MTMTSFKASRRPLFPALMLVVSFGAAGAEQQNSSDVTVSNRTVVLFKAPPAGAQYRLMPTDVLSVRVFGHPELSSDATIDERGMISLPFLDEVAAAGLTLERFRSEVLLRLQKLHKNPQISVYLRESSQRETVVVYAEYDKRGRETEVYTSMMAAGNLEFRWKVRSMGHDEFVLSFFSRNSFLDGRESYKVKALLDGGESFTLGRAIKIRPTIVTAYYDPSLEIRLKVPRPTLAQVAKAREVRIRLEDSEFKLRANDLEALRFMVAHSRKPAHFSATSLNRRRTLYTPPLTCKFSIDILRRAQWPRNSFHHQVQF